MLSNNNHRWRARDKVAASRYTQDPVVWHNRRPRGCAVSIWRGVITIPGQRQGREAAEAGDRVDG